jgi:hypothetical protein
MMKTTRQYLTACGVFLMPFLLLTACSSTGMERSEKASKTMQTVENDITRIAAQLDVTGRSLDNLTMAGQTDVKKAFEVYAENVASIAKMQRSFAAHADEMQSKGTEYFEEWKKEGDTYTNPEIQRLSDQRRRTLSAVYTRIAETSVGVKAAFAAYVSDVSEIQTYLSTDLTPNGIKAIAPISARVVADGANLRDAINHVQTAISSAKAELSHQGS